MTYIESDRETDAARRDAARDVYLDFLGREAAGEPADFESLCATQPQLAVELRRLRAESVVFARPSAPAPPLPAQRYVRGEEIGHGGMGAVYRVWDARLDRALAMKVLHGRGFHAEASQLHDERARRFLREARITAQLDHPGIVPVHELDTESTERPFFTMKLVHGIDLAKAFELAWSGADGWTVTRAVTVMLRICEAMAFAHSRGVVHRDLKPANVMVGRFGEVFVMDWGIAHVDAARERPTADTEAARGDSAANELADAALTAHGDVLGTAVYMAPEQARGDLQAIDARTDVYALGALLYHLLAKRRPYADAKSKPTTQVVLARLLSGPPESLSRIAPDAPIELVSICEKAMAREQHGRYASMQELADDLRAYLELRVVRAHERGAWAELRKYVRRNKALSAATAAAVVLLIGGLSGIAYVQAQGKRDVELRNLEITKQKNRADENAKDARRSAQVSDSVSSFLADVFKDQRPENARAREITARELLDQAAAAIHGRAGLDSQARERLLQVMADAYGTLRYPEQAHPLLVELRYSAAARLGADDPHTLDLSLQAASIYLIWRRPEPALSALHELFDRYVALGRSKEVGAFDTRLRIAQALDMAFRRDEAEHALLALLEEGRVVLGPAHPTIASAAKFLAVVYLEQARAQEACDVIDGELAVRRDDGDSSRAWIASLQELRAQAELVRKNDPELAEIGLRDRLEAQLAQDPRDELALCNAEHDLAANLMLQSRAGEALEHYEAAYDARVKLYGEKSAMTLAAMVDVAQACAGSGELQRAEQLARVALDGLSKESPDFNLDISNALNVLARVCAAQDRLDEALAYARRRLDGLAAEDPRRADRRKLVDTIEARIDARKK